MCVWFRCIFSYFCLHLSLLHPVSFFSTIKPLLHLFECYYLSSIILRLQLISITEHFFFFTFHTLLFQFVFSKAKTYKKHTLLHYAFHMNYIITDHSSIKIHILHASHFDHGYSRSHPLYPLFNSFSPSNFGTRSVLLASFSCFTSCFFFFTFGLYSIFLPPFVISYLSLLFVILLLSYPIFLFPPSPSSPYRSSPFISYPSFSLCILLSSPFPPSIPIFLYYLLSPSPSLTAL